MNSLERNLRRWLRGDTAAAPAVARAVSRAYGTEDLAVALESAVAEALSGCRPSRRALLMRVRCGRGCLSERTYFRAKKEIVHRLAEVVARRTSAAPNGRPRRAEGASPIALPMVDRLIPEPIAAERYRGADRGRALSAAALCSEMAGDQERADTLLAQAGENVLNQFGQRDAASAFEVAQNRFFIARCRGNLQAMRSAVRDMAGLRGRLSSPAQLKFSLDCSEVFLYEGRLRDAHSELEFAFLNAPSRAGTLLWSIAVVRRAQIALARHDLRAAEEAGENAARIAAAHADIRVYAAEVLGRSSLRTGRPWSSEGLEECRSAFHALCVRTILARHHLQRKRYGAALETARASYAQALRLRYWNLASRSAATIAICLGTQADAQGWLADALRLYLMPQRQNAFIGDDLFDAGPPASRLVRTFLRSEATVALIGQEYLRRFPTSLLEGGGDSLLERAALFILQGVLDPQTPLQADVFTAAAKRLARQSVRLDLIEREIRRLSGFMCSLSILWPFEQRGEFVADSRRQTCRALYVLRRTLARRQWLALRR